MPAIKDINGVSPSVIFIRVLLQTGDVCSTYCLSLRLPYVRRIIWLYRAPAHTTLICICVRHRTVLISYTANNYSHMVYISQTITIYDAYFKSGSRHMTLGTILLVVLVLILLGALPSWPHSRSWGYGPSGVVGLLVVILVIMLVTGNI